MNGLGHKSLQFAVRPSLLPFVCYARWCHYLIQQPCHLIKDAYYKLIFASRGFHSPLFAPWLPAPTASFFLIFLSPLSLWGPAPKYRTCCSCSGCPGYYGGGPCVGYVCARLYDYIIFWFNAEAPADAVAIFQHKKHPHALPCPACRKSWKLCWYFSWSWCCLWLMCDIDASSLWAVLLLSLKRATSHEFPPPPLCSTCCLVFVLGVFPMMRAFRLWAIIKGSEQDGLNKFDMALGIGIGIGHPRSHYD